jgi:hypothetical protein|tara:strand:+ start:475 stop:582 length:108 start_codon:yes stop_codon:yes gene_type:complete
MIERIVKLEMAGLAIIFIICLVGVVEIIRAIRNRN